MVRGGDSGEDVLVVPVVVEDRVLMQTIAVHNGMITKREILRRVPFVLAILLFTLIFELAWKMSLCQGLGK